MSTLSEKRMEDYFNEQFINHFARMSGCIHDNAAVHGWWDESREDGTLIALIMSEAAEALEALRKLRDVGRAPVIVCTGQDGDPNDPGNLQELLRQRDDWQLQEQFMVLGAVPRNDMFLLMRQSVAVMTTTLFEGFGLSVVEARYLGKPVLASDLPVLREHQSPRISFFNPHDADDLARKMDEVWQHASLDKDRENEAAAEHDTAQQQFANDFMAMLESCC